MMKERNFILLAMSTLPKQIRITDFKTPESTDITDCQSQLEPVVRYILSKCSSEEVYIFSMTTSETEERKHIGPVEIEKPKHIEPEKNTKGQRIRRVSDPVGDESDISAVKFFEERIKNSPEYPGDSNCLFGSKTIDLSMPEEAIRVAVECIRNYKAEVPSCPVRLWVDTHGGIRDVSLLTNVVAFLLHQFTDIKLEGIYGTEYSSDSTKEPRVIDQRNAFESLSFVSGMSDFMNFGNVDVLEAYYKTNSSGGTEEIQELIKAMKLISDGTQFCDPYLYKQGLDALGVAIQEIEKEALNPENALLPIFYRTIRDDYNVLLDPEKRTSFDIIKRCVRKKQYQQALTFIEVLMPEYFFEKRILYFSESDKDIVKKAAEEAGREYEGSVGFAFNKYNMSYMGKCFKHSEDVRNTLFGRAGILAGRRKAGEFDQDFSSCLRDDVKNDLTKGIRTGFSKNVDVTLFSNNEVSYHITMLSDVPEKDLQKAGRIMRMHNVLKSSRNKFNHAVSSDDSAEIKNRRPYLEDIENILNIYIKDIEDLVKLMP